MFWDKKDDKKGLPELPPLKPSFSSSNFDSEPIEKQSLPSFPDSPMRRGFSQTAIKESVQTTDLPELPSQFRSREIDELPPKKISFNTEQAKTEDVYVKIDRFHSARKALNSARDKLKEIDEVMKKIRETKMREEQELASWESEISSVKTKIEDVTKNIFEKIE